jgi:hypothetical protein
MDPAEIKLIRKVVIKERGAEDFRKIRQSGAGKMCWKFPRLSIK